MPGPQKTAQENISFNFSFTSLHSVASYGSVMNTFQISPLVCIYRGLSKRLQSSWRNEKLQWNKSWHHRRVFYYLWIYDEEIVKESSMEELGLRGGRESKRGESGSSRCRRTMNSQRWDAFGRLWEWWGGLAVWSKPSLSRPFCFFLENYNLRLMWGHN